MTDFHVSIQSSEIDPRERARRLSRTYQFILSWDFPEKQSAASDDLGQETETAEEKVPSNEDTVNLFYHHSQSRGCCHEQ